MRVRYEYSHLEGGFYMDILKISSNDGLYGSRLCLQITRRQKDMMEIDAGS
jgi:hypothetical protein